VLALDNTVATSNSQGSKEKEKRKRISGKKQPLKMDGVTSALSDLKLDQIPVYLLKTVSAPSDGYETHFTSLENGKFKPIFVPVLEHVFRDDALKKLRLSAERFAFAGGSPATARQIATHNPAKRYGGLIFTSQRAVDAFTIMVAKLEPSKRAMLFDPQMPIYVVGPATANGVRAMGLPCPVVGEETGNGDALAKFILEHQRSLPEEVTHLQGQRLPLLFPVGEQRRDIIPKTLTSEDLPPAERTPVVELVVYETGEMATFEEDFTMLVREAKKAGVKEQWVVVFSPQGCEAMLMGLGWLETSNGKFSEARRQATSAPMRTRIASIGPTTKQYLMEQFGFQADVCAEKPSPEGVAEGILASMKADN
jgi:uroporphyrinogen-III synthase